VQHTNFGGGSPIVRGLIGPQILILVDGVRLSNSVYRTGPVQYLNLIDQHALSKVEILRGPGSVLYGSDAVGGVINAFPLSAPASGPAGTLLLSHQSASASLIGHGHLGFGAGGLGLIGGFTLKGLGDLRGGGKVGTQPYSGYDSWSGLAQVVYRVEGGPLRGWEVKAGYMSTGIEDAGRTDKLHDKLSLKMYDNTDHLTWVRLHMIYPCMRSESDLTVSYQNFFERADTIKVGPDFKLWRSMTRDTTDVNTLGLDLQMTTRVLDERLVLRYGGMWYRDWVGSARKSMQAGTPWVSSADQAYPDGSTYDTFGAFVVASADVMRLGDVHVLRLDAGYRFHGMVSNAPSTESVPAVKFDSLGHVAMGGIQYLHSDRANLAFTFSQGFRAPNLQEAAMLGDTGKFFHIPNDGLGPEKANTFELLGRSRLGPLTLGGTVYVTLLDDVIKRENTSWEGQEEIGGKDVVHNVNGGRGLLFGAEIQLHVDIGRGLSVRGHLTYTWGEERVEEGPDVPLTRVPPPFGMLVLRYDMGNPEVFAFVETGVRFAGKQFRLSPEDERDARIPEGGTPGWWTMSARVGLGILSRLRMVMAFDNLLDRKYKYHASGLYSPGLNAVVTLELML
jgi:outer membrane receptor protein involved in Fe transport